MAYTTQDAYKAIQQAIAKYSLSLREAATLFAIGDQESGLDPNAVGDGGTSFGVFQHHAGGAGGPTIATARTYQNPFKAADERARQVKAGGVDTGAEAAALQRPADRAGYARSVDTKISKWVKNLQGAGGGKKWSPTRDRARAMAKDYGLVHTSGDRITKTTSSGNVSDHWRGQSGSWADDYAGPVENMRAFESAVAKLPGIKQVLGPNNNIDGNHGDHVHVAGHSSGTNAAGNTLDATFFGPGSGLGDAIGQAGDKAIDGAGAAAGLAGDALSGVASAVGESLLKSVVTLAMLGGAVALIVYGAIRATGHTGTEAAMLAATKGRSAA